MANAVSLKKSKQFKGTKENLIYILPFIIAAAIAPLIVFYKNIPLDDLLKQYWPSDENVDFFSYYKSILIMISAAVAILMLGLKAYKQEITFKKININIPIAVYAVFITVSALLSKYQTVSAHGFPDRYEGVYVLLSYIVLLLSAINLLNTDRQIKIFLVFLFVSAAIIGCIGAFQYFGLDLFKSMFGKLLILPQKDHYLAESLSFLFDEYTIYATLYNTNFVGSYTAMLFPLVYLLFLMAKKISVKVLLGILTIIMYINWLGCNSRGGYVGVVIAAAIALVFLRKVIFKNIKIVLTSVVVFVVILFIMNTVSGGKLIGRMTSEVGSKTEQSQLSDFEDIKLEGKRISVIESKNRFSLELKEDQLYFLDTENNALTINTGADGVITFSDERYKNYSVYQDMETDLITIFFYDNQLSLRIDPDGLKIVGQRGKLLDKLENTQQFGFEGREKLGSSRGYIWSRSIPLLIKYLFIGSGPDTFAFVFPQFDVVGKIKAFNTVNQIVDKPHNLYLQIGINTGVVSLVAVLALFAMYLFTCGKLYFRCDYSNIYEITGAVMFCAICGYLATAFFNDSLVSVAPVFWVLLGLGISCNYYNIENDKKRKKNSQ